MTKDFLPVSKNDMRDRGWDELDVIIVTGDAYVDHPSYGAALIGRLLESKGYKVGIIAQPDWHDTKDFEKLGKPRLFFGVTSGNTDSMIANYSAARKPRKIDKYSPGDRAGLRPDRAAIVYANRIREAFKDVRIVLGGVEASLRRLAHYDYWSGKVRHSILVDSRSDILVYGMGEHQVLEIAERLSGAGQARTLEGIRGTAIITNNLDDIKEHILLPSFEEVSADHEKYNRAFLSVYGEMDPQSARPVVQKDAARYIVQFAPAMPLREKEMDEIYALKYARGWHPAYEASGGVKGFETVKFSITSHRGCPGECSFCSLYFHQGRMIQSRSAASIINEAETIASLRDFKGTITDVGGPTANLYAADCSNWCDKGSCSSRKCLIPEKCVKLKLGYDKCIDLYRKLRAIPKVKFVFIGSGFRYDLMTDSYAENYLKEISKYHVSGLLKIAPEHCSDNVLDLMNKPRFAVYEKFVKLFKETARTLGKNIFIVNYFISAHPGASLAETLKLALYLAKRGVCPEQIQDFIPSPMTRSTCMYYTGVDPFTRKKVYVARDDAERRMQRALIQYDRPANRHLIVAALKKLDSMHVLKKLTGSKHFGRNKGKFENDNF
ncbi:MAG: YgiQ family radical SAM protein [Candidatus Omnitrophica bacterium]|nr:YgiQ family radical SAM protein [Candidatus Omnitrophota bacterium]